ncbi:MAG: GNAT family N-acetyltransferase [Candidatus Lokiarchaeota archaeon]|nr:GNAT family N-acetyltransferase [Candidatus Lokiarchaeota archaeon]
MKNRTFEIPNLSDLYKLTEKDYTKASKVLGEAFKVDPIWKRILHNQFNKFRTVFGISLKYTLKFGKAYALTANMDGIACWLTSPYTNVTLWRLLYSGAIKPVMQLKWKIISNIFKVYNRVDKHRKNFKQIPFLYLFALGVHPEKQGEGIGSKLLKLMLDQLDSDIPVYLETETEKNVRFYERFGFKISKKIHVPLVNLPVYVMVYHNK